MESWSLKIALKLFVSRQRQKRLMAICGHDWSRLEPSKSKSQSNSIDSGIVYQLRALYLTVATP
ncbi:MAG TPA: hypothetical protein VN367_09855 [Chlorobaculum sp.]|nr:hypothetical protein [Chlorobaculum sp.]